MIESKANIVYRLKSGFGIVILLVVIYFFVSFVFTNINQTYSQELLDIKLPSEQSLNNLRNLIIESNLLIKNWVYIDKKSDTKGKRRLLELHDEEYPKIKKELEDIKNNWDQNQIEELNSIFLNIESLFNLHKEIISQLTEFSDYNDVSKLFYVQPMVDDGGEIIVLNDNIIKQIDTILVFFRNNTDLSIQKINNSFSFFSKLVITVSIFILIIILLIARFVIKRIVKNIDLREITQKELKNHREQLELIVEERTEKLTQEINERLNAEKTKLRLIDELESKNSELERFTYTVSHDLRSPLITIKGFLGILSNDFKNNKLERVDSNIQRISNAANTMQSLLEDLLQLSRIGRIVNPSENVNVEDVVTNVIEMLNALIVQKNVSITKMDNFPKVYADKQRLHEVFQNLIENAIKYSDPEKDVKEIQVGFNDFETEIMFFVKDNGIGIPEEFQEKIFGLFDQLNKDSEGTGVGLALVKRIIEFHNGKIWVESKGVGYGSTFYFTLQKKNL